MCKNSDFCSTSTEIRIALTLKCFCIAFFLDNAKSTIDWQEYFCLFPSGSNATVPLPFSHFCAWWAFWIRRRCGVEGGAALRAVWHWRQCCNAGIAGGALLWHCRWWVKVPGAARLVFCMYYQVISSILASIVLCEYCKQCPLFCQKIVQNGIKGTIIGFG